MNLQELFDKTMEGEPEARIRNTKTAVRILAQALGYNSPATCPQEAFNLPLNQVYRLLERQLQSKGPHTIRNAKNYLSKLFRNAAEKGLLSLISSHITKRFTQDDYENRPHRQGYHVEKNDGTYFRFTCWTPRLLKEWEDLYHWCTDPLVDGRSATHRKRPITMRIYLIQCESFFGYLLREKHIPVDTLSFDTLFTFPLVRDYVHWQVNIRNHKVTTLVRQFLACLKTLSHTYRHEEDFHHAISQLSRSLPKPLPVYSKEDVWVPLATLGQVARAMWPTRPPQDYYRNGSRTAVQAGMSLMLHIWCCIPYRQRNMREMELDKNLYRNTEGKWVLRFEGEQLKISYKDGTRNVFTLPFPEYLVPILEQYLNVWRPVLLKKRGTSTNLLFLSFTGQAYQPRALNDFVKRIVYRHTGKALHPHLIRTIWATEYIKKTGDIYRAAVMLNDKLETVVKNYSHLSQQGVAEHVYNVLKDNVNPVSLPYPPTQKTAA